MSSRLNLALDEGGLVLPDTDEIAVFHARQDTDLSGLPMDRVRIIQPLYPDHAALNAAGYTCVVSEFDTPFRFAAALVCLPRARAQARELIARAMAVTDGPVIIDGAKTDGIDSALKDLRKRAPVQGPVSKAHGKLFWLQSDAADLSDWLPLPNQTADGFTTAPGVFSADGIDPASRLLAETLPAKIGPHVIDLGAGWGYLASEILENPRIRELDLVEADHIALDCARHNISDDRARFHWADARTWRPGHKANTVVTNPPFHTGRASDPNLGRGFIRAAADMLIPSGQLWMVANRHLAYEATLKDCFADVTEVSGDNRFKVLHASRPARPRR